MTERRNRGILTAKDRRIMEESTPDQYPSDFRWRTREKFKQGLADLAFISKNFEDEDIAEVFGVLTDSDLSDETSYTHESFTQSTVIDALGLFFQGTELVGDQDESVLEDLIQQAIRGAYHRNRRDLVVGTVDFDFETVPRQEAHDRATEKIQDGEFPTTSGRRAVFEATLPDLYDSDDQEDHPYPDHDIILRGTELTQYVADHLDKIEAGLEQIEFQPDSSDNQSRQPEVFCEDQAGQLVLINITETPITRHNIDRAESLLREYGGPERVRSILLSPDMGLLKQRQKATELGLEFYEFQLGPYGVITRIESDDSWNS